LPGVLQVGKSTEDVALGPFDLGTELSVRIEPVEASLLLCRQEGEDGPGRPGDTCMLSVDAERAAVRPKLLDINDFETVPCEQFRCREQGKVGEVLVVDGVELVALHQLQ